MTRTLRKERLSEILRDFPKESVAEFILTTYILLVVEQALQPKVVDYSARRGQLQRISDAAASLLDAIADLQNVDLRPPAQRAMRLAELIVECGGVQELDDVRKAGKLDAIHRELDARDGTRANERGEPDGAGSEWNVHDASIHALLHVHNLMHAADSEIRSLPRVRVGRKAADTAGTLTEIARTYLRIFGVAPTTTKAGVFYQLAVEITGQSAPERAVRKAVTTVTKRRNTTKK